MLSVVRSCCSGAPSQPDRMVDLSSEPRSDQSGPAQPAPRERAAPALHERTNVTQLATPTSDVSESSCAATYRKLQVPIPLPAGDELVEIVRLPSPQPNTREELATRRGPNKRDAPIDNPIESASARTSGNGATKRQRKEERTEWGLKTVKCSGRPGKLGCPH